LLSTGWQNALFIKNKANNKSTKYTKHLIFWCHDIKEPAYFQLIYFQSKPSL